MFTTQLRRCAALCVLACMLALPAPVLAGPLDQGRYYYSSHGDPATMSALAQEAYYGSYREPETPKAPQAASDGNAVLIIALSIGGALVLVAAGLDGRRRNNRRHRGVPA
jgi:hypothetical protein